MGLKDQGIVVEKETPKEQTPEDNKPVGGASETSTLKEIEIDGEKIPFTEEEFRKGYLRNKDYTHKTQELGDRGKSVEEFEQMSTWLNDPANAESAEKIRNIVEGKSYVPKTEEEEDEFVSEEKKEIQRLNTRVDEQGREIKSLSSSTAKDKQVLSEKEILKEVSEAQEKYKLSDEDIDIVLAISQTKGGANIVGVAKSYVDRLTVRDKATIKNYLENKDKDGDEPPFIGNNLPPETPGEKVSLSDGSAKKRFASTISKMMKAAKE